ncbi:MAG: aminotransferase class V-fold PLP-dependent enzyme, partial [Oscillospiraceae bacterium]|nr:aminotransferase class V-fold PLP-dependent enzyme [Oscillospiraceae bacterium]
MIYFDNAATTFRKPESVYKAVQNALRTCSSPGRGGYKQADNAADVMYDLRRGAAELFNVPGEENVVLTMNATHALNIAIKSLAGPGDKVITSGYEHNSVMRPLKAVGADVTALRTPL